MTDYTVTTWGQSYSDVTVPSGQTCQVRIIQMEDLVELDLVDKLDTLGVLTQEEVIDPVRRPADHKQRQATKAEEAEQTQRQGTQQLFREPEKFKTMATVLDTIVAASVVQPPLVSAYDSAGNRVPHDDRDPGAVYTDSVSIDDKMHIFDHCFGGMQKLQQFRDQSGEDVVPVATESGDEQPTEQSVGDHSRGDGVLL